MLTGKKYDVNDPLIGLAVDFRIRRLWIDSKLIKLQVWYPTGGYRPILPRYFRGTDGFVIVHDCCDSNAKCNLATSMNEIQKSAPRTAKTMIVRGQCDEHKPNGDAIKCFNVDEAKNIPSVDLDYEHPEQLEELFQSMLRRIIDDIFPTEFSEKSNSSKNFEKNGHCSFL